MSGGQNDDIAIFQFEGEGGVTALLDTTFNETFPEISIDGDWMAYVSDESGASEVYVRPFPDINAGRWQVSVGGGPEPFWGRNGNELFYRNGDALMAVAIQTDPSFNAGSPELVFERHCFAGPGGRSRDPAGV